MQVLKAMKKPIQHDELTGVVKKKVGYAYLLFLINVVTIIVVLLLEKSVSDISPEWKSLIRIMTGFMSAVIMFIALFTILKIEKTSIATIGIRKKGLKSSVLVCVVLIGNYIYLYVTRKPVSLDLFSNILFYMVFVGFIEEIILRGYIMSRLNAFHGNLLGLVIGGILFYAAHLPNEVIFHGKTVNDILVGRVDISLLGGIFAHLVFSYLYTRNNNIIGVSAIHGYLDLLGTL